MTKPMMIAITSTPPTAPPIIAPVFEPPSLLAAVLTDSVAVGLADDEDEDTDFDGAYTLNCSGWVMNAGTRSPSLQAGASVLQAPDLQHPQNVGLDEHV